VDAKVDLGRASSRRIDRREMSSATAFLPALDLSNAVVALSTASDIALALWLLFRGNSAPIELGRVARAALVVGTFAVLKMIGARFVGQSFFLVVHLAYADLMVLLPLVGIALLLAARRRRVAPPVRALAIASLVCIPIAVDATFVEPYRLVTERASIPLSSARSGAHPITIAVLADIQCNFVTDREREAVRRAMEAHPDLVLLPGDLVQVGTHRLPEILDDFHALLAPLVAPLGVYFVQGNCETKEDARRLLAGTPVRFLDDEVLELSLADRRVTLCGVDLSFASARARAALERIQRAPGSDDVRIVVAHRPDVIEALPRDSRVDLIVCGHTHGGQVVIPFFGPPITLSDVPRSIAEGGSHVLDGKRIYVSRGIGWEHGHAPRVRFLCPPEVSVLTLGQ
jgi:predicted MPP superfamily phosphohydrolase